MAKRKKEKWLRPIVQGVVVSFVASAIMWPFGYYSGRKSLKREVADGLSILNVESTAEAFDTILATADSIVSGLSNSNPHPGLASLTSARTSLEELAQRITEVRTTEYYSVEELKRLADDGAASIGITLLGADTPHEKFIKEHIKQPKRTVEGIAATNQYISTMRASLGILEREFAMPHISEPSRLADEISQIKQQAAAAKASLLSRQAAALETLERFGKD